MLAYSSFNTSSPNPLAQKKAPATGARAKSPNSVQTVSFARVRGGPLIRIKPRADQLRSSNRRTPGASGFLTLIQVLLGPDFVGTRPILADDALAAKLAGVGEDSGPVALQMLAEL